MDTHKKYINQKSMRLYIILLIVCLAGCILRYPDFETALWSASDTNYQCLMNAKAMLSADDEAVSFLPLITFCEETDYGLEYSSGAFDKETGKYFYYISFPAFPFTAFALFLKITQMAVNEISMYIFCSILFCISTLVVMRLFIVIFEGRLNQRYIAFIVGTTYLCSVEIMHSMGLTYWGQNWYMIFFPVLCVQFLKLVRMDKPKISNYFVFFLFGFMLLQTEWSGYFALFAFWLISLIRMIRGHEKKYLYLAIGMAVETFLSIAGFVAIRVSLVGGSEFIGVLTQRVTGRSRIADYSVFEVEKTLLYSFGGMIVLSAVYIAWAILYKFQNRKKFSIKKDDIPILLLFVIPLSENHLLVNHALTYSMDKMKWYFVIAFLLLYIISELKGIKRAKLIICYSMAVVMAISLLSYLFVENNYRWNDRKLCASRELARFIETNYADNVLGQLGTNSVWGYSKMLFGHGIVKESDIQSLKERAEKMHKRYAVALNDMELCYTQKWYSSAVIYDLSEKKYIVAGSLCNSYEDKLNDFEYLKEAECIDMYINGFNNFISRISFPQDSTVREKKILIYEFMANADLGDNIIYYLSEVAAVPNLIMVDNTNAGEWALGVSASRNRLIFLKTDNNKRILEDAGAFFSNGVEAGITNMFTDEGHIYIDLETDNITAFSYPNTIVVED